MRPERRRGDEEEEDVEEEGEDEDEVEEEEDEEVDPSIQWYHKGYCQVVESMPSACLERSLLELWGEVSLLPNQINHHSDNKETLHSNMLGRGEPRCERKVHPMFCSGGQIH